MDAVSQWTFIETAAEKRGVSPEAIRKWRERGVPYRYRLPILEDATAAHVNLDQRLFDAPPTMPDRRRTGLSPLVRLATAS